MQVYNVRIVDEYDEPFAHMPVKLTYNMGCTFYGLDESSRITDGSGRAQFATHMHPDTIAALFERHNWDETVVYQGLEFEYDRNEYYIYNRVQNDEELSNPFRPAFKEHDEVTIRMMKLGNLKVELDDYSFDDFGLLLKFRLTGSKGVIPIDITSRNYFFNPEIHGPWPIPGSTDLQLEWEIYDVGPEETHTLKRSGTIPNLNIPEGETKLILIQ